MDINYKRRLFQQKLQAGLDQKAMMGGATRAVEHLTEAVELAAAPPRLEHPLLEIASYRLAHAKLRTAQCPEDYHQIRRLLTSAERSSGYLSLMSRVLQLVTMHRLAWFEPIDERPYAKEAIDNVWTEVVDALRRIEQNEFQKSVLKSTALLQSAPFSIVELAGYFTGCNLSHFDGMTYRDELDVEFRGLSSEMPYVVCASDDKPLDIARRIPRDIAMDMISDRLKRGMADIIFVLDEDGGYAQLTNGKKFAKKKNVLVFGLAVGALTYDQIAAPLGGGTLTRYIDRINARLNGAGISREAIRMDRPTVYSFAPEVRVVGAISRKVLTSRVLADEWGK